MEFITSPVIIFPLESFLPGIVEEIEEKYGKLNISTGGADTNLKKELPQLITFVNENTSSILQEALK